jgi:hypothetical protein
MPRSRVVFAENRMVNDCGSHLFDLCAWFFCTWFTRHHTKYQVPSTKLKHCLNPQLTIVRIRNESRSVRSAFLMFFKQISDLGLRNDVCHGTSENKGQYVHKRSVQGRSEMKRLLAFIVVLTLLVITGTIVSADGQTHRTTSLHTSQTLSPTVLAQLNY